MPNKSLPGYPPPVGQFLISSGRDLYDEDRLLRRKLLSETTNSGLQTTIHHLLGSFYSHIWVGTPPQRVSVIVDTGSHYTAFPCVGCKCGVHMDPYFDPSKSSSSLIPRCSGGATKCFMKQSYSEGSSWHAYKVRDRMWLGGESLLSMPNAFNLSTDFEFGCQDVETGLFRTQHVDGIMGLSGASDTYPHVLHANGVSKSKVFALCFRHGGGVLTVGGVDPSIHLKPDVIVFAKQVSRKAAGWFAVRLLDVLFRHPKTNQVVSIGVPFYKFNTGKGVIIDSGTTDTYLPSSAQAQFLSLFKQMAGIVYTNSKRDLSSEEFERLPTIIYRLEGTDGKPIDLESPPSSYTETIVKTSQSPLKNARFAFRVYLTEPMGTVLGANFMLGHNVIFDYDERRIGFAKSECLPSNPGIMSAKHDKSKETSRQAPNFLGHLDVLNSELDAINACERTITLASRCSADCTTLAIQTVSHSVDSSESLDGKLLSGKQSWSQGCHNVTIDEPCSVFCTRDFGNTPYRATDGGTICPIGPWSLCHANCTQHRYFPILSQRSSQLKSPQACVSTRETRKCSTFLCSLDAFVVTFGLKIRNNVVDSWSFVNKEDVLHSLAIAFQLDDSQFHLYAGPTYNPSSDDFSLEVKLRLSISQYGRDRANRLAMAVAKKALLPRFPDILSLLLNGNTTSG